MLYVAIWYVSIRYEGEGRTAVSSSNIVYLVGLHIYCKMTHGTYNIKVCYGLPQFLQAIHVSKANSLQLRPSKYFPPRDLSIITQLFSAGMYEPQEPYPWQIILYRCSRYCGCTIWNLLRITFL